MTYDETTEKISMSALACLLSEANRYCLDFKDRDLLIADVDDTVYRIDTSNEDTNALCALREEYYKTLYPDGNRPEVIIDAYVECDHIIY